MNKILFCLLLPVATVVVADNSSLVTRHSSLVPSGGNAAGWDADPVAWHTDGEAFVCANAGRALAPAPKGRRVEISARVTPLKASDPQYASFGVGVFDDIDRYWNLAILKGPDAKGAWHRYELKAQSEGEWGAETRLMTRVENKRSGEWAWEHPFDLRLSFASNRVEGVISDAATGTEVYRCVHVPKEGAALPVPAGRPCLFVSGDLRGRVENVRFLVEDEVPEKTRDFPAYRPVGPETGVKGKATGFFHMEKIDGVDWAIDPLGRGVLLVGTDWCTPRGSICEALGYSIYGRWVKGHYSSTEAWAKETAARLGEWGFTFLPCGGDESLYYRNLAYANAADRIYFSHRMCRGDPDWRIAEYRPAPCTAFPNVFHPDFEKACDWWARQRCAPYRDDPWLVGYFIDNELAWWGAVYANSAGGLFDLVVTKPDTHPAKKALLAYLKEQGLGDSGKNGGWRTLPASVKLGFLRLAAERYFSATTAAIRRADPNHMVLGCRFAGGPSGIHPAVMEIAGKYCDIVSFNHYPWADLDQGIVVDSRSNPVPVTNLYGAAHDRAKKPLLLTEWSFPALDAGMPCTHGAGQRFYTQAERVQASELYARTLLSLPFFAGYSYFRWVDQPPLGIRKTFPENSNYGLISEQGVPYEGLTAMFARVQRTRATSDELRVTSDESRAANTPLSEHDRFFSAVTNKLVTRHSSLVTGEAPLVTRHSSLVTGDAPLVTRHSSLVTPPSVGFHKEADGRWSLSNGLVRLTGRVGGKYMADEIAYNQELAKAEAATNSSLPDAWRPVGRWGALLEGERDGIPYWTDVSRVTDVSFVRDNATGIVTVEIRAEGEGRSDGGRKKTAAGGPPAPRHGVSPQPHSEVAGSPQQGAEGEPHFAFTHRLSVAPGCADILAEIVSLENTGTAPFKVKFLFMRPFAIQEQPGQTDTVPNLWKGPVEDYWTLDDGSLWGIASHDSGVLKASLWYREEDGSQHPDVRCREGDAFVLAPGGVFHPSIPMGVRIRFVPPNAIDAK